MARLAESSAGFLDLLEGSLFVCWVLDQALVSERGEACRGTVRIGLAEGREDISESR